MYIDKYGRTLFYMACEQGRMDVLEWLMDHGISKYDMTRPRSKCTDMPHMGWWYDDIVYMDGISEWTNGIQNAVCVMCI